MYNTEFTQKVLTAMTKRDVQFVLSSILLILFYGFDYVNFLSGIIGVLTTLCLYVQCIEDPGPIFSKFLIKVGPIRHFKRRYRNVPKLFLSVFITVATYGFLSIMFLFWKLIEAKYLVTIILISFVNFYSFLLLFNYPYWANLFFVLLIFVCTLIFAIMQYYEYKKRKFQGTFKKVATNLLTAFQLLRGTDGKANMAVNAMLIYQLFDSQQIKWVLSGFRFLESQGDFGDFIGASNFDAFMPSAKLGSFEEFTAKWDKFKQIPSSNVYNSLKRFGAYVFVCGLTDCFGTKFNEGAFAKHLRSIGENNIEKLSPEHLMIDIVDTTIAFIKTSKRIFMGDNWIDALEHEDEVLALISEYEALRIDCDTYVEKHISLTDLSDRVQDFCMRGRRIKAGTFMPTIGKMVGDMAAELRRIHVKIANSGARKLPFSILLYGPSGVGKSSITDYLFQMYLNYSTKSGFNKDLDGWNSKRDKYSRNFADKFWSEYDKQWAVILDDVAQEKDSVLGHKDTSSLSEIIMVLNNVPFATTQAEISKKGSVPLMARAVVGTTNVKNLSAHAVYQVPAAVLRRFQYVVTVKVKEQYCLPGTTQLNSDRSHFDSWEFIIERTNVVGDKIEYTRLHSTDTVGMRGLQEFMKVAVVTHEKAQEAFMKRSNEGVEFCPKCDYMTETCSCDMVAASGEIEHVFWSLSSSWYYLIGDYPRYVKAKNSSINTSYLFGSLAVMLAILYVIRTMLKSEAEFTAAATESNIWARDTDDMMAFVSTPSKTITDEDLVNVLTKNIFTITVKSSKGKREQRAFGIKGRYVATTWHMFAELCDTEYTIELYSGKQNQPIKDRVSFVIKHEDLIISENKDLIFVTHPDMREVKDITKYLTSQLPRTFSGKFYTLAENEWVPILRGATYKGAYRCGAPDVDMSVRGNYDGMIKLPYEDIPGTCGGPILVSVQGAQILGGIASCINLNGKTAVGFLHLTPRDISLIEEENMMSAGDFDYITEDNPKGDPIPVHSKSLIRHFTLDGNGVPICSFNGARRSPRTRTINTPFAKMVCDRLEKPLMHKAPHMRGALVNGEWLDPNLLGIKKRITTYGTHDKALLSEVCDSIIDDISKFIDFKKVTPVDVDCALNGIDGRVFVDAVDRSTSGGFKFPGPKRKYLLGDPGYRLEPNEDIHKWIDWIEAQYLNNKRANIVFDANLKDEALPIAKVDAYKTRLFTACGIDFTIVIRKVFVTLCAELMKHGLEIGIAAGLDCYTQWNDLYNKLNKFNNVGTRVSAGDYSGYDTGMSPARIRAGMSIMVALCKRSGNFTPQQFKIMEGIIADLAHPFVNFNGDVLMLYGTNCSGHPLTLILNSLVNLVDVRYCYCKSTGAKPETFMDNISLMVMGDDNIFTTRDGVNFGHSDLQAELAKLNIKYTMADKHSETRNYSSINEVDFLKREFRFLPEYPDYCVAPLSLDSIFKMLTNYTSSRSVSIDQQMAGIIGTAKREIALHGREAFDKYSSLLDDIISRHSGIKPWLTSHYFLDYEATLRFVLFKEKSETIPEIGDFVAATRDPNAIDWPLFSVALVSSVLSIIVSVFLSYLYMVYGRPYSLIRDDTYQYDRNLFFEMPTLATLGQFVYACWMLNRCRLGINPYPATSYCFWVWALMNFMFRIMECIEYYYITRNIVSPGYAPIHFGEFYFDGTYCRHNIIYCPPCTTGSIPCIENDSHEA